MTGDGLGLSYPQVGWVVLDAIRDRGLTGSVMLGGSPAVCVFADQGDIYWAEAVGAPSIGARLVDTGVVTAVQLERGAVRHEGVERLERLFERVPAIDRDTVLVAVRALAEQSLVSIAAQMLAGVVVQPYIHHSSGMHLWNAEHPVARRNDVGRAAMWAPPEPAVAGPAVVANVVPPVLSVPHTPVVPVALEVPGTPEVPEASEAPVVPIAPEVHVSTPPNATAEPDDFSLVWNDAPTPPASFAATADTSAGSPSPPRAATTEAPGGSFDATESMLTDEFEVKWPASSVEPEGSDHPDTFGAQHFEQPSARSTLSGQQHTPAWTPTTGGDVVHPDRREPNESLTEALSDLIVLVDRDLAAVRNDVDDLDEAGSELLSSDEFIAVRRAIASADTGLLNARRRLIDHRLRDRSSRGSSSGPGGRRGSGPGNGPGSAPGSGSSDGLRTTAVSGGVDEFGVAEGRDDLDDLAGGTPALRRIMGNLRRV